jgi:serine/threonine protein kinase
VSPTKQQADKAWEAAQEAWEQLVNNKELDNFTRSLDSSRFSAVQALLGEAEERAGTYNYVVAMDKFRQAKALHAELTKPAQPTTTAAPAPPMPTPAAPARPTPQTSRNAPTLTSDLAPGINSTDAVSDLEPVDPARLMPQTSGYASTLNRDAVVGINDDEEDDDLEGDSDLESQVEEDSDLETDEDAVADVPAGQGNPSAEPSPAVLNNPLRSEATATGNGGYTATLTSNNLLGGDVGATENTGHAAGTTVTNPIPAATPAPQAAQPAVATPPATANRYTVPLAFNNPIPAATPAPQAAQPAVATPPAPAQAPQPAKPSRWIAGEMPDLDLPPATKEWAEKLDFTKYKSTQFLGAGAGGAALRLVSDDPTVPKLVFKIPPPTNPHKTPEEMAQDQQEEAAFYRRAGDHPAIPKCLGVKQLGNYKGLVMECVEGKNLHKTMIDLKKDYDAGKLSHEEYWGSIQQPIKQTLEVLVHLDKMGVVHQDIKADNIMVDKTTGTVKVIDFGTMIEATQEVEVEHAETGGQETTRRGGHIEPYWLPVQMGVVPPETFDPQAAQTGISPKADVFGAGGIAYQAGEGRMPAYGMEGLEPEKYHDRTPKVTEIVRHGNSGDFAKPTSEGKSKSILDVGGKNVEGQDRPVDAFHETSQQVGAADPVTGRVVDPDTGQVNVKESAGKEKNVGKHAAATAYSDFINKVMHPNPAMRLSAAQALDHPFMKKPLLEPDKAAALLMRRLNDEPPAAPAPADKPTALHQELMDTYADQTAALDAEAEERARQVAAKSPRKRPAQLQELLDKQAGHAARLDEMAEQRAKRLAPLIAKSQKDFAENYQDILDRLKDGLARQDPSQDTPQQAAARQRLQDPTPPNLNELRALNKASIELDLTENAQHILALLTKKLEGQDPSQDTPEQAAAWQRLQDPTPPDAAELRQLYRVAMCVARTDQERVRKQQYVVNELSALLADQDPSEDTPEQTAVRKRLRNPTLPDGAELDKLVQVLNRLVAKASTSSTTPTAPQSTTTADQVDSSNTTTTTTSTTNVTAPQPTTAGQVASSNTTTSSTPSTPSTTSTTPATSRPEPKAEQVGEEPPSDDGAELLKKLRNGKDQLSVGQCKILLNHINSISSGSDREKLLDKMKAHLTRREWKEVIDE